MVMVTMTMVVVTMARLVSVVMIVWMVVILMITETMVITGDDGEGRREWQWPRLMDMMVGWWL